ncbi:MULTISPECIES: hypothetical protein [Limibacillus]|jgi:hypothetical protein|uniref:Uncharacterized protein n=1 Tax=Limibacillus halophilus TaxID=1579333 RepID=A0A839SU74_9PROT|nr:hypothetical protein [Limibacillus halophilus]MBB3064473.1 hypothetical protein [Limibacillus halophilus]
MGLTATVVALAAFGVFMVFCNLMSRRETPPGQPRLIPYTGLQFIGLLGFILMLGHLVTLLTGKPFTGRQGF